MARFEDELHALLVDVERGAPAPSGLVERLLREVPAAPRQRAWPTVLIRGTGQLLVTAGVVVLLFLGYEVYVTNYFTHVAQQAARHELLTTWRTAVRDPLLPLPGQAAPEVAAGSGVAILYIPRFGRDYSWVVVEGTSDADIAKGPGHYTGTALPGQAGNFAIAGHRVGKGEPFLNLNTLRPGDPVVVETDSRWFIYRVKGADDRDGITGSQVVSPGDSAVLDPVPNRPGAAPTERLMTMTTCHPKFTATHRLVVRAALSTSVPASGTSMPATVLALYGAGAS